MPVRPKTYCVQYDDATAVGGSRVVVILRTDSLAEAIAAAAAEKEREAYVRHTPSGLQRYLYEGRPVWLDERGVEHPEPSNDGR